MSERIAEDVARNPISRLTEYCQLCQAQDVRPGFCRAQGVRPSSQEDLYVVAAQFAGHSFEAESTSKKEARRMAADLALH